MVVLSELDRAAVIARRNSDGDDLDLLHSLADQQDRSRNEANFPVASKLSYPDAVTSLKDSENSREGLGTAT